MNGEFQRIWKGALEVYCKEQSRHFSGQTEENNEKTAVGVTLSGPSPKSRVSWTRSTNANHFIATFGTNQPTNQPSELWSTATQLVKKSRSSFIEPDGTLPCSQEPATRPHPEPNQPGPQRPILCLKDPF
jgi:hypothetical protein